MCIHSETPCKTILIVYTSENPVQAIGIISVSYTHLYCHKEKIGVNPRKGANLSKKEKFPLYLSPEKKAILERRYQEMCIRDR